MRPYPSNNKVLDGMEKRRKMNRRLFPGLLMTNKWRLYSQRNMYQVISFTCLALYFHLPYLRRILISKFLMKLKPFNERYTKTQPHKTSTCFIPVSNFWSRSQNPRSSFRSIEIFIFPVFFCCHVFESGRNSWGENDSIWSHLSPLLQQVPTLVDQRL